MEHDEYYKYLGIEKNRTCDLKMNTNRFQRNWDGNENNADDKQQTWLKIVQLSIHRNYGVSNYKSQSKQIKIRHH